MEELSAQSNQRDDLASLQQTIRDLEEHLDSSIRSERHAQHRIKQLEEEIKNLKTLEEVGMWFLHSRGGGNVIPDMVLALSR